MIKGSAREKSAVPADSPPAERFATMADAGGSPEDNQKMPIAQMSKAIYAFQRKFASVGEWATSVTSHWSTMPGISTTAVCSQRRSAGKSRRQRGRRIF